MFSVVLGRKQRADATRNALNVMNRFVDTFIKLGKELSSSGEPLLCISTSKRLRKSIKNHAKNSEKKFVGQRMGVTPKSRLAPKSWVVAHLEFCKAPFKNFHASAHARCFLVFQTFQLKTDRSTCFDSTLNNEPNTK